MGEVFPQLIADGGVEDISQHGLQCNRPEILRIIRYTLFVD